MWKGIVNLCNSYFKGKETELKERIELIEKVCSKENKDELMSVYLTYVSSRNPLKRVSQCNSYIIGMDVIKIKNIISELNNSYDSDTLEKVYNEKYKSQYIREKVDHIKSFNTGIFGINALLKSESKYIEMTFILNNIQDYKDSNRLKNIVPTLVIILTVMFTYRVSLKI